MSKKKQFKKIVKGTNFVTPTVLGYYSIKDGVAELSYGTGFRHEPIFGVTVVKNGKHDHELSNPFFDKKEAIEYIASLQ